MARKAIEAGVDRQKRLDKAVSASKKKFEKEEAAAIKKAADK